MNRGEKNTHGVGGYKGTWKNFRGYDIKKNMARIGSQNRGGIKNEGGKRKFTRYNIEN